MQRYRRPAQMSTAEVGGSHQLFAEHGRSGRRAMTMGGTAETDKWVHTGGKRSVVVAANVSIDGVSMQLQKRSGKIQLRSLTAARTAKLLEDTAKLHGGMLRAWPLGKTPTELTLRYNQYNLRPTPSSTLERSQQKVTDQNGAISIFHVLPLSESLAPTARRNLPSPVTIHDSGDGITSARLVAQEPVAAAPPPPSGSKRQRASPESSVLAAQGRVTPRRQQRPMLHDDVSSTFLALQTILPSKPRSVRCVMAITQLVT